MKSGEMEIRDRRTEGSRQQVKNRGQGSDVRGKW
jgi:hypothetical protein